MRLRSGFTYIELLITLTVIGVIFLPTIQLFSHSLYFARESSELITATNLAKWQMEKIKNSNLMEKNLAVLGNQQYPPADQPALKMNNGFWRINTAVVDSAPMQIKVSVFKDKETKPIIVLTTLIQDMIWEKVKQG